MALRLSCCAISSSWEESSSCTVVDAWAPPILREAGTGPKLRENEDVVAVSGGYDDGRREVMSVGDISSGSGGVMNKPFVDTPGDGDFSLGSCGGGLRDGGCCDSCDDSMCEGVNGGRGTGSVGSIGLDFLGSGFVVLKLGRLARSMLCRWASKPFLCH